MSVYGTLFNKVKKNDMSNIYTYRPSSVRQRVSQNDLIGIKIVVRRIIESIVVMNLMFLLSACGLGIEGKPAIKSDIDPIAFSDAQIQDMLKERIDKLHRNVGIVVGIVGPNGNRIISYGKLNQNDNRILNADTVFEIGSISKTFTSLLLADMVNKGEVALTDPVEKYLPSGVNVPKKNGKSITLQHLANHTSGLPKDPNTMEDYGSPEALLEFLSTFELTRDIGAEYEYSNVGAGLLGYVLARRAQTDFETLVNRRITQPLGMKSTAIALSTDMKNRMAIGHDANLQETPNLDLPIGLAGMGGLRSTMTDMLKYLDANLGTLKSDLAPSMKSMLNNRIPTGIPNLDNGLGWQIVNKYGADIAMHNGGTFGFSSFMAFNPITKVGVVILSNTVDEGEIGVDDIGLHILDKRFELLQKRNQVMIDPKLLDNFVDRYETSSGIKYVVSRDGDSIFLQPNDEEKYMLNYEGGNTFFIDDFNSVCFDTDSTGKVQGMVIHRFGWYYTNMLAKRVGTQTSPGFQTMVTCN